MHGVKARLDALTAAVWKWKGSHGIPYEDLDPLSRALVDFARELGSLDTEGKKAAYCAAHGWAADELECLMEGFHLFNGYPAK